MNYPHTGGLANSDGGPDSAEMDEAARIESLTAALAGWFGRHRDMHCLLAVDPSQRDLIESEADGGEPFASQRRADVVIEHEAFPDAHRPYLLELDLSTRAGADALAHSVSVAIEDRRPESMAEGLGQRVGGWLASSASIDEVAAHWSRLMLQRDESGRACMLRFFDSRALALLWPVLSPAQQQTVLGPARAWHVLDAGARPSVHLASLEPRASFSLSVEQWREVHRHGLVNRALALHARACARQPESGEIETAVSAAARAEQYGLLDREDWIAFIGHALSWHPQFDLHPKVLQLLARRSAEDFYTGEISQLSAAEIDEIRDGAWYQRLRSSVSQ